MGGRPWWASPAARGGLPRGRATPLRAGRCGRSVQRAWPVPEEPRCRKETWPIPPHLQWFQGDGAVSVKPTPLLSPQCFYAAVWFAGASQTATAVAAREGCVHFRCLLTCTAATVQRGHRPLKSVCAPGVVMGRSSGNTVTGFTAAGLQLDLGKGWTLTSETRTMKLCQRKRV